MASFNIYSSCICRDIFGFKVSSEHKVENFLQSSSPLVNFIYNTKPRKTLSDDSFENIDKLNNFQKKCIKNDYNKTVLDYFSSNADYFIVDLIHIANTNLIKEIYADGEEHYFTYSAWFKMAYESGLNTFFDNSQLLIVNRFDLLKSIGTEEAIRSFINWLVYEKGYKPEQIILVKNMRTREYLADNQIVSFEEGSRKEVNDLLDDLYDIFENLLPGCHKIKMPKCVYGDADHKWGLMDLHFCSEYYDYLYDCIEAIVSDKNICNDIELLYERYSSKLQEKYINYLKNSISLIEGKNLVKGFDICSNNDILLDIGSKLIERKCIAKNDSDNCLISKEYYSIQEFALPFVEVNHKYLASSCSCVRGVVGNRKNVGKSWITINESTCVIFNEFSIQIRHSGRNSLGQMQIIQSIEEMEALYGKYVTFSVWARCKQICDDNDRGGTIAIINEEEYSGRFYAKKEFSNMEWKKIALTVKLPEKESFVAIKLLLRANASKSINGMHSIVEFSMPKFEIGAFSTKTTNL